MDQLFKLLLDQFMSNPAIQGVVVSIALAKLRDIFKGLDSAAKDPAQVKNVQLLVGFLSLVVTLLTAWSTGHLSQVDPKLLENFLTVVIAALGTHTLGQDVKKAVAKNGK